MAYELFNQTTTLSRKVSRQFWKKALELAQQYGWRPMGTIAPSYHDFNLLNAEWHGTYLSNEGQTVLIYGAVVESDPSAPTSPVSGGGVNYIVSFRANAWFEIEIDPN